MSHVTTIDLHITDLDSLAKACDRLGLELVRNQITFKSYQHGLRCDHLIKVKDARAGAYEMGLVKRTDGKSGWMLSWDHTMASELAAKVSYSGKIDYGSRTGNADKLKDWYAAEVAQKQMRRQGFSVRAVQKGRKVQVLCSK
jgi:hypothetical protein